MYKTYSEILFVIKNLNTQTKHPLTEEKLLKHWLLSIPQGNHVKASLVSHVHLSEKRPDPDENSVLLTYFKGNLLIRLSPVLRAKPLHTRMQDPSTSYGEIFTEEKSVWTISWQKIPQDNEIYTNICIADVTYPFRPPITWEEI